MKRSQLALSKAVESGDTDLGESAGSAPSRPPGEHADLCVCVCPVYTVVTYLKNEMNRGDFFMTLRNQPVALSLYRQVKSKVMTGRHNHLKAKKSPRITKSVLEI